MTGLTHTLNQLVSSTQDTCPLYSVPEVQSTTALGPEQQSTSVSSIGAAIIASTARTSSMKHTRSCDLSLPYPQLSRSNNASFPRRRAEDSATTTTIGLTSCLVSTGLLLEPRALRIPPVPELLHATSISFALCLLWNNCVVISRSAHPNTQLGNYSTVVTLRCFLAGWVQWAQGRTSRKRWSLLPTTEISMSRSGKFTLSLPSGVPHFSDSRSILF